MSTVAVAAACVCGSIGRTDLRQCPEHFRIWDGDVRLTSVGRIVRHFFPMDPKIPPDVLENARERGDEVDRLFTEYVDQGFVRVPAGTRRDSKDLLVKLVKWFGDQGFTDVQTKPVLGRDPVGGVCDFIFDGVLYELKSTYNVEATHRLQLGGYMHIGLMPGRVLHVTERHATPRVIAADDSDVADFRDLLAAYQVLEKRGVIA